MKITRFETHLCSYAFPEDKVWWGGSWDLDAKAVRFHAIILRVHTDEGISGLGEASPWGDCRAVEAQIHRLEPRFVGRDPFDVEKLTVHTGDDRSEQRRWGPSIAPCGTSSARPPARPSTACWPRMAISSPTASAPMPAAG